MKKQLIGQMINAQFRNTSTGAAFMPEIVDSFRNKAHSNICFAEGDETTEPFMSFSSQEELEAYIAKSTKANTGEDDDKKKPSLFDQRRQQEEEEKKKDANLKAVQKAVKFDTSFDDLVAKNKEYFPESVKTIRGDVKTDDEVEKASLIAATAAKEYFLIPQNLESLSPADRQRVESEILNVRFVEQIDGLAVWGLVEQSLYGHELANKHKNANNFMDKNGTGQTGYKNVDTFLKNLFPEKVVSLN